MMTMHILSILIALPLVGALVIALFVKNDEQGNSNAKHAALWTTVVTFIASLIVWRHFDGSTHAFQFMERAPWFDGYNINFLLGIDGISLFMILLTTFLMPICILCSWEAITKRIREYMMAFLVLEAMVIGVFCALDMVLFYLFFEGMLIPMFLIIGIWGGDRRVYASYKFFLYTLAGSVLFLAALLYLYFTFGTTSIPELMNLAPTLTLSVQQWLWLAMLASFAVKVPMWPVHTWLPDAHVQAPTAGSVILAGILLKMGAYGFLRFSLPMLPEASHHFADLIFVLSCIAVVYTSLVALMQEDMKKLIAYSSVAHMGFVTLGIFSFNQQGIEGAIFQMISHGLISGALFLCVGVVYDRLHTREINRYGGLVHNMPIYAAIFMIFTMASVGLPGTAGFVGEMMVLVGAFQASQWAAFFAATGLILGAAYMLWLYRRVCFGELTKRDLKKLPDVSKRELIIFAPIIVMTILIGVYPKPVLSTLHPSVTHLMSQVSVSGHAKSSDELIETIDTSEADMEEKVGAESELSIDEALPAELPSDEIEVKQKEAH
ncbi:MAG: NADH-quinone oxidoreductase subunit M [Rickettsiales bacterium]|nr:NADH-quinone oxidoreductase subunit M [Rickettsiales bacterium]